MSDAVVVALIGSVGLDTVALIGLVPVLLSIRKHSKTAATQSTSANDQVSNDHSTNLRVELDARNLQYARGIAEVKTGINASEQRLGRRIGRIERRLEIVEDTIPNPRRKR